MLQLSHMKKVYKVLIAIVLVIGIVGSTIYGTYKIAYKKAVKETVATYNSIFNKYATIANVIAILEDEYYYGEASEEYEEELLEAALYGMVSLSCDPYTEYMSVEELNEFRGSLSNSFVGIGVNYKEVEGNILVIKVLKSSPAEKAQLQPGDIITAVDGETCLEKGIDYIVDKIKGQEGTDLVVTYQRDGINYDVTITRASVNDTVYSEIHDGIGIIRISSFSDGTAVEMHDHLEAFRNDGVNDLIIDLRNNTGGYAITLANMCAYFMDEGDIVMREEDKDGNEVITKVNPSDLASELGTSFDKYTYDNIVVLVNEYSASCSEVFTMAMKENCGAIVVGKTTYGKGVAQTMDQLVDGGVLKYTNYIWKSGNGVSIAQEGIVPDVEVDLDDALYRAYIELEEDETYQYDDVNENVKSMQLFLKFLKYDVDRTDGYFSKGTQDALEEFESDNGLDIDGVLSQGDASRLVSKMIKAYTLQPYEYDYQMMKAVEVISNNN